MEIKPSIKLFLIPAILFAVFLGFGNEAKAADYYVSPSGSDSSSGLSGAPFKTIQKAANIVNPGDTVIVKDGTYTDTDSDNFIIQLNRSGNAINWITLRAENQNGAVLDGQNNTTGACIILFSSLHHVIIDGFEIKKCKEGVFTNEGAHDIKVLNNDIHNISDYCGSADSANDGWGIATGAQVGYPIYNWTISGNKIHDIGRPTYCQGAGYISKGDYGIYLNGHDMTLINNIFYDNYAGWDIHIGRSCVDANDGQNFLISNNTFYGYDPNHTGNIIFFIRDGCYGLSFSNVKIQNNISYDPKGGTLVRTIGGVQSGINVMNNLINTGSIRTSSDPYYVPGTVTGNIIDQDPLFTNLSGRNFHLQPTSPAINAGLAPNAPTADFDGKNARPQGGAYDIGAYEYVSGGSDTTSPAAPSGLQVQ